MVVKKKGATSGGKMKMVMKGGKMVPAFAADGVGKNGAAVHDVGGAKVDDGWIWTIHCCCCGREGLP